MKQKLLGISILILACAAVLFWRGRSNPQEAFQRLKEQNGIQDLNLVLITLDTTRADRLPMYGYNGVETPNLQELADEGTLFKECIAPVGLTLPSHSSIFTGTFPTYHGVRVNGNNPLSDKHQALAEILGENGWECGAFVAAFVLDGRWGLHQGFHHYNDEFDLKKHQKLDLAAVQRPANEVVDAALAWMDGQTEDPFFSWIHLYDPHSPYEPPEPFHSQYKDKGPNALYDGEIAFVDQQIGRVTRWLEDRDLEKNTIVVVVGDHGEALGDHGESSHGYFIYDETLKVPLIIKTPFPELAQIQAPSQVRTLDLFPTLLEIMGLPTPTQNQAASLLPHMFHPDRQEDLPAYSESMVPQIQYGWSPLQSLRTRDYKYIHAPNPELFDLRSDPGETRNIASQEPETAARFKQDLDLMIAQTEKDAPALEAADLDQETLEALASLGYVGSPVSMRNESGADPKDMVHIYEAVIVAGGKINRNEYQEAASILEKVLETDPGVHQARLLLANAVESLGQLETAKDHLDQILRADPSNIQALVGMADILMETNKAAQTITVCKKALSVDPRNTQALTLTGEAYMSRDRPQEALPYFKEAVAVQEKISRYRLNLASCHLALNNLGPAEVILNGILQKHPKFPGANYHQGLLEEKKGKPQAAQSAYQQELAHYEAHVPARFNLGMLFYKQGDLAAYVREMEALVHNAPNEPRGYLFLARGLLKQNGDLDRVLDLTDKGALLARKPDQKALAWFLKADAYGRQGKPQKVKEALAEANAYRDQAKSN